MLACGVPTARLTSPVQALQYLTHRLSMQRCKAQSQTYTSNSAPGMLSKRVLPRLSRPSFSPPPSYRHPGSRHCIITCSLDPRATPAPSDNDPTTHLSAPLEAASSTASISTSTSDPGASTSTVTDPRAKGGEDLSARKAKRSKGRGRHRNDAPGPNVAKYVDQPLLIDKPKGWTSFDVCGKLRGVLRIQRVGHAGTLDPMATGLLVVCTGKATKQVESFMGMDKWYSGTLVLGESTASYDAETEVTETLPWEHVTDEELQEAARKLTGDLQQVPPMYSAIKRGGQKLYELAREGVEVERPPRAVTVHSFEVRRVPDQPPPTPSISTSAEPTPEGAPPPTSSSATPAPEAAAAARASSSMQPAHPPGSSRTVWFRVHCSKGTYVRSLVHDLGRAVGTVAHMTALRRDAIGDLRVEDAWQLPELVEMIALARTADLAASEGAAELGGAEGEGV